MSFKFSDILLIWIIYLSYFNLTCFLSFVGICQNQVSWTRLLYSTTTLFPPDQFQILNQNRSVLQSYNYYCHSLIWKLESEHLCMSSAPSFVVGACDSCRLFLVTFSSKRHKNKTGESKQPVCPGCCALGRATPWAADLFSEFSGSPEDGYSLRRFSLSVWSFFLIIFTPLPFFFLLIFFSYHSSFHSHVSYIFLYRGRVNQ
jgi:hypothetical protein